MSSPATNKPFIADTKYYDDLLTAVFEHRMLSVEQVTRLLYKSSVLTTARNRLRRLAFKKDPADTVYLLQHKLPTTDIGQKPVFYSLSSEGMHYFKEQGFNVQKRYRPVEQRELGYPTIMHLLGLNDVAIALRLLPKQVPNLRIARWFHEHELSTMQIEVSFASRLYDEQLNETPVKVKVKPDAWFDVRVSRPDLKDLQFGIWIEFDRGTEYSTQFKQKLRGILHIIESGKYAEVFGTRFVKVLFPTTGGDDRVKNMRKWARDVFSITHEKGEVSEMFLFTALPPHAKNPDMVGSLDPVALFTQPVWYAPFSNTETLPVLNL